METYGYEMEELLPVVAALGEKYTGYEHSSVTYEKAQMLMEAVLYCIGEYEGTSLQEEREEARGQEEKGALLLKNKKISAQEAFGKGQDLVTEKVNKLRRLYNELIPGFWDYGLICLGDTVRKGIPSFFLNYDVRFAPQETLLTLDYPVLKDLGGRTGVDAVWEYMMCIAVEQRFLGKLPASLVREMLMAYHEEYEGLIENLCSILLAGILARIMTEYPSGADNVSDSHGPGKGQHASPGCPYAWKKQQALALLLEKTLKEKLDCDEEIMDYLGYAIPDTVRRALAYADSGNRF